ncbi:hypothetical protein W97_08793 [Coniosporium apollinis CBS 100218]|uniref:Uncharacterized protein n=1 Tax=Coniosporium apollinis (strain CBS 100218) TaxID=1168221 RepID=R7Z5Z6_CONA1|nr:uncharacterized protein W97_08793 [Coniosporium apollinis CBS 100218]EON69533.1 hypothetical protein W97_08793 [Coniosporium apollinis CBS 100218]
MKFFTLILLALPAAYAAVIAAPDAGTSALAAREATATAEAHTLIPRKTCKRERRFRPDRHGVCVDASKPDACQGGDMYQEDCPGVQVCCIIDVSSP